MSSTLEVGQKLVELCRQNRNVEAANSLYDPNIVSIEAMKDPVFPQRIEGIDGVRKKNQWWVDTHQIHSAEALGPFPHGDRFMVHFKYDVTSNDGPMKGKRMQMEEGALYTVKNGKIVHEEFFYHFPT